mmetsp:Transcript_3628/g.8954  ORF Transcript_3628/g.8954 Transcript_3628/m.8954 type:complete len:369 (-) Transcript_3628:106-1212(-)
MKTTTEKAPLLGQQGGGKKFNGIKPSQMLRRLIARLPTSVLCLALGVCGLGITWQTAADYLIAAQFVKDAADVVSLISFNIGVSILLLYSIKLILCPSLVLEDLLSAQGNAELPCLDMAMMMIAWWLRIHGYHSLGRVIYSVAVLLHCVFLLVFFRHVKFQDISSMTPNWLIPFIGLSMAAGTGASLGLGDWTAYFFWIAFLSFLILFPVMLYRLHAYPEGSRAEAQYPYIAFPAALLLTSWIAMGGHQGHVMTHFLFLVQMCSIVLVSLRISNMFSMNFEKDFSSLAFPSDVSAKCSILYTHLYMAESGVMVICSWIFVFLATLSVGYLCFKFGSIALGATIDESNASMIDRLKESKNVDETRESDL